MNAQEILDTCDDVIDFTARKEEINEADKIATAREEVKSKLNGGK